MAVETLDYSVFAPPGSPIREEGASTGLQRLIKLFSDEDHAMSLLNRGSAHSQVSTGFNCTIDAIAEFKRTMSQLVGRSGHARFRKGPSVSAPSTSEDESFSFVPLKRQKTMSSADDGHTLGPSNKAQRSTSSLSLNMQQWPSFSGHVQDLNISIGGIIAPKIESERHCGPKIETAKNSGAQNNTAEILAEIPSTSVSACPSISLAGFNVQTEKSLPCLNFAAPDRHDSELTACIQEQESTLHPVSMVCDGDDRNSNMHSTVICNNLGLNECATVTKPMIYKASTNDVYARSGLQNKNLHGHSLQKNVIELLDQLGNHTSRHVTCSDGLSEKKKPQRSSGLPPLHPKTKYLSKSVDHHQSSGKCKSSKTCHCMKSRKSRHNKRIIRVPTGTDDVASIPTDQFSWKKFGQKLSEGSRHPRCYYKCSTAKGCPAMKRIEWSLDDLSFIVVTYKGEHKHMPGVH